MDRILQGATATISATFDVDGAPTDPAPDTATVRIVRDDGTELLASSAAANGAGPGVFTNTLSGAQTAELDRLTATWTSALGTVITHHEIVGGFLFTLVDARALSPLDDVAAYPTAKIAAARTWAEQRLENACGVAFVPRYDRETVSGSGGTDLMLARPKLRRIRAVTNDNTVVDVTDARVTSSRIAYLAGGWPFGHENLSVAYEHGADFPEEPVAQAALLLAKQRLVDSGVDDRATELRTELGTLKLGDAPPEVERVVRDYGYAAFGL